MLDTVFSIQTDLLSENIYFHISPPILLGGKYTKSAEFHDFLMTKIINGENAVHRSKKFAAMAARYCRIVFDFIVTDEVVLVELGVKL